MNFENSKQFITSHLFQILLIVLGFFVITSYYSLTNAYSKKYHYKLRKEYLFEGFDNGKERELFKDGFCKNLENSKSLEDNCNKLVKDLCVNVECCAYAKFRNEPGKCVAARNNEPLFKNSKKDNPLSYFIHQNKKFTL